MNVSGIVPAIVGDDWVVFDKSGTFAFDESVWATIWLVGGGCDGTDGYYDEKKKIVHGGVGGGGGYVYRFGKIALFKNIEYAITVATTNDRTGTCITIRGKKYTCANKGRLVKNGGLESMINSRKAMVNSQNGLIGVLTPIGYVGSSGGGGCAVFKDITATFGKGGEGAGSGRNVYSNMITDEIKATVISQINAKNYGCGGGGNTFCHNCSSLEDIDLKSEGMGGCVIIAYESYDDKFPNLTVRYWKNVGKSRSLDEDTREMIEMLQSKYLDAEAQNKALKEKVEELEKQIADKDGG